MCPKAAWERPPNPPEAMRGRSRGRGHSLTNKEEGGEGLSGRLQDSDDPGPLTPALDALLDFGANLRPPADATRTAKDTEAVVPGLQSPTTQVREGRGRQIEFSQWGTRVGGTLPGIGWRGGEGRGRWSCWRGWTGGASRIPGTVAETVWYPGYRTFCLTVRSPVGFQAT